MLRSALLALLVLAAPPARAQWAPLAVPLPSSFTSVLAIAELRGALYVGTSDGLFRSPDDGLTWEPLTQGLPFEARVTAIVATPLYLVLAVDNVGVYRSTDGAAWQSASAGLGADADEVLTLHASAGGGLYAGTGGNNTDSEGIYCSANHAVSWTVCNAGIPGGGSTGRRRGVEAITSMGEAVIISVHGNFGEVNDSFRSTDGGATWTEIPGMGSAGAFTNDGQQLYAIGGFGFVRVSTDGGETWVERDAALPGFVGMIHGRGPELWATMSNGPPHRSTNRAVTWAPTTDGLPDEADVDEVHVGARYVFGGTRRHNLWRRPLPGTTASEAGAPGRALALTAAPNPARGAATLTLTLAAPEAVTVAVYDALGRAVARLHDGPLPAGPHPFALDAGRLPAGVYAVRATGGAAAVTRRLTVLR